MSEILEFIIEGKDRYSGTFDKLRSHLPSIKTLAIGAAGAITGLSAALFATAKTTATAYDKYQKFSDQTALSTEYLSKMTVAADYAGVSQDALFKSIQKLSIGVGEADRGIGQAKDTFEELGISVKDSTGKLKTADQLMPILANKFSNMTDSTKRLEMAQKLFGQRNTSMLQLLNQGSGALDEYTASAEKMGVVVSSNAGRNAALFNDTIADSMRVLKGLKNVIGEQVMPYITGLAKKFNEFAINNRDKIIDFGKSFLNTMLNILEKGVYAVTSIKTAWYALEEVWVGTKIAFNELVMYIIKKTQSLVEEEEKELEKAGEKGFLGRFIEGTKKVVGATAFMGLTFAKEGAKKVYKENMAELNGATELLEEENTKLSDKLIELAQRTFPIENADEYISKMRAGITELEALGTAAIDIKQEQNEIEAEVLTEKLANENLIKEEAAQTFLDAYTKQQEQLAQMTETADINRLNSFLSTLSKEDRAYFTSNEQRLKSLSTRLKKEEEEKTKSDQKKAKLENSFQSLFGGIVSSGLKRNTGLYKSAATAETIMSTYKSAQAAFSSFAGLGPWGVAAGIVAAAAATAAGLSRVSQINAAHGGMTNVPKEQTYLLDKNERVLSPNQNKDFTEFINNGGGGSNIENVNIEILPNATNAEALLYMDKSDWLNITENNIIPALKTLSGQGVVV